MPRKCFRCHHFCFGRRDKKKSQLYFSIPIRLPTEDKPMKKTYFDENFQKFCINFDEHGRHYNFFDAREVVSEFLNVFENMFIRRLNHKQVSFKCTFTIVNCQPARRVEFAEITDSRVWQTNV